MRAYIDYVCCWPEVEDGRLGLGLKVGLLEEEVRMRRWTLVQVGHAWDIDVSRRQLLFWLL